MGMRAISHRSLRHNSSETLRNVAAGEIIEVTNHGQVAAVLVPQTSPSYEKLIAVGKVRQPWGRSVDLRHIRRMKSPRTAAEIIAHVPRQTMIAYVDTSGGDESSGG
jgi:prevent-host-death family protein